MDTQEPHGVVEKPKVCHVRDKEKYKAVYIGRPSRWGNPFSHKKIDGVIEMSTREEAVTAYTQWIMHPDQSQLVQDAREFLKGKTLACWCKHIGNPSSGALCHGDVLWLIANSVPVLVQGNIFDG